MTTPANVLLIRVPHQPVNQDRYHIAFQDAGFSVASVAPLEAVFVAMDELREVVRTRIGNGGYRNVVITSGRACEALRNVLSNGTVTTDKADGGEGETSRPCLWPPPWGGIVSFYVVGHATASLLRELGCPHGDIRGGESGTSEQLARFIVGDLEERKAPKDSLLFLTGDKTRDVLPSILASEGVRVHEQKVYETRGSRTFERDLDDAVAGIPDKSKPWWIAHFAPSSASFTTPFLVKSFALQDSDEGTYLARIAAIGPTTQSRLVHDLHLPVSAVASKPTPEELLAAIIST